LNHQELLRESLWDILRYQKPTEFGHFPRRNHHQQRCRSSEEAFCTQKNLDYHFEEGNNEENSEDFQIKTIEYTVPQTAPDTEADSEEPDEDSGQEENLTRPQRERRPPTWMQDFVMSFLCESLGLEVPTCRNYLFVVVQFCNYRYFDSLCT
jgi:hypothetical protein